VKSDFRIEINEELSPMDRGEKYDDPICEILEANNAGFVTGGGTKSSHGRVEFCYVDVSSEDAERAKSLVSKYLLEVGAPRGTRVSGEPLQP
jgi:hypothetical protein